jgi:hypothetical protein
MQVDSRTPALLRDTGAQVKVIEENGGAGESITHPDVVNNRARDVVASIGVDRAFENDSSPTATETPYVIKRH